MSFIRLLTAFAIGISSEVFASNIENAIEKGIDPMTVRCSYAKIDDTICVAFSITHTSTSNPAVTMSKK